MELKGYNSSSLRSTWLNQKRKYLFFNRVIKKASNLMIEENFFTKNYKKAKIVDIFNFFFNLQKKVTYYHCKIFKSCFFITKASIWALVDWCAMKNSPDIWVFIFQYSWSKKLKYRESRQFFIAHQSTRYLVLIKNK